MFQFVPVEGVGGLGGYIHLAVVKEIPMSPDQICGEGLAQVEMGPVVANSRREYWWLDGVTKFTSKVHLRELRTDPNMFTPSLVRPDYQY